MSKYDRRFLVPYLEDICSIYSASMELNNKIDEYHSKIFDAQQPVKIQKPHEPILEDTSLGCMGIAGFVFGLMGLSVFIGLITDPSGIGTMPMGLAILLGLFGIIIGFGVFWFSRDESLAAENRNKEAQKQYNAALKRFEEMQRGSREEKRKQIAMIPSYRKSIAEYENELTRLDNLLQLVYNANIIPRHYRNVYAAWYLYDWFVYGSSNNLDMALNTFVLEEIKEKLDIVIENQRAIMLTQRIALAEQRQANKDQQDHNREMKKLAQQIARDIDEEKQYMKMVECNTAATAYFAAANYFK